MLKLNGSLTQVMSPEILGEWLWETIKKYYWNILSRQKIAIFNSANVTFWSLVPLDNDKDVIWVWFLRSAGLDLRFGISVWNFRFFLPWWPYFNVLSHVMLQKLGAKIEWISSLKLSTMQTFQIPTVIDSLKSMLLLFAAYRKVSLQ